MRGVEAHDRLVNPLPTGRSIVHVFKFGNVESKSIGVCVDDAGLSTAGSPQLDVGDGALSFKGDRFPILLTQHQVRQAERCASLAGTHGVEEVAEAVAVNVAVAGHSETKAFARVAFGEQLAVRADAVG